MASSPVTLANVDIRSGPGQSNGLLGTIPNKTAVSLHCYVAGEPIAGPYGTEDLWDALTGGGYVPDALIYTGSNKAVVSACPSAQFGVGTYPVAWTGGGNAQAHTGASTGDAPVGSGIPDGRLVVVSCETPGQGVTDSAGYTSNLWDRLASGGYIANVYLDTQVNGSTPGLPACSSTSPPSTGPITSTTSHNWSGYAGVAKNVSEVRAAWIVPQATCSSASNGSTAVIWAGIDGKANTNYLVQAGTGVQCSAKDKPVYYTWWESNPTIAATNIATISAGAKVTVDITYHVGPATYFVVQLAVNGSVQFARQVTIKNEPRSQAECIVEAPISSVTKRPVPLTEFKPATFTDCRVTSTSAAGQQIGRGSINGVAVTRYTLSDASNRTQASAGNPGSGGAPWTVTWKRLN